MAGRYGARRSGLHVSYLKLFDVLILRFIAAEAKWGFKWTFQVYRKGAPSPGSQNVWSILLEVSMLSVQRSCWGRFSMSLNYLFSLMLADPVLIWWLHCLRSVAPSCSRTWRPWRLTLVRPSEGASCYSCWVRWLGENAPKCCGLSLAVGDW